MRELTGCANTGAKTAVQQYMIMEGVAIKRTSMKSYSSIYPVYLITRLLFVAGYFE
jgi:hypothetical protein